MTLQILTRAVSISRGPDPSGAEAPLVSFADRHEWTRALPGVADDWKPMA